jgi:peroxiredoxin
MPEEPHADDPQAHALHDRMVQALRDAETLYLESDYQQRSEGWTGALFVYRAWLQKPNYARIEVRTEETLTGVVVGDGEYFHTYWPAGRPRYHADTDEGYAETQFGVYWRKPSPPGRHSLGHETIGLCGRRAGMSMTILDLSTFHGYTDALQARIDGITGLGVKRIGDEEHDGLRVSIMEGQRTRDLWLSRRDHLPRELHEVVHVQCDLVTDEMWREVRVDQEMPTEELFSWTPPEGWREWQPPAIRMLAVGTEAPDLELPDTEGKLCRVSDYRGQVVWLVIWRSGCPPCRDEVPYAQRVHEEFAGRGVVVLGLNLMDHPDRLAEFLDRNHVTFRNLCVTMDSFAEVRDAYPRGGVPSTYLIDRDGRIAATWVGHGASDDRGREALAELGIT